MNISAGRPTTTPNTQGLLAALHYALRHGFKALKVVSDSELMVKQINGQYKVSSPTLKELYEQAMKLIDQLDCFEIKHVLREKNREADRLANLAMDRGIAKKAPAVQRNRCGQRSRCRSAGAQRRGARRRSPVHGSAAAGRHAGEGITP